MMCMKQVREEQRVKNKNYNKPEMEIILLNQSEDIVTLSSGADTGATPTVDYSTIWGEE